MPTKPFSARRCARPSGDCCPKNARNLSSGSVRPACARQTQEEPANCRPPKRVLGTEVQAARCLAEQARKGGIAARCAPAYNSRAAKECPKSGEPAAPYTARPVDEEISPIFYGNKQPGHRASGTFTEVRCRGHDHEAPQRCSRTGFQPANGKQRGMRDCAGVVAGGQQKRTMPCAR